MRPNSLLAATVLAAVVLMDGTSAADDLEIYLTQVKPLLAKR